MAHYGMLRDYAFDADADDIRGADLYASDGKIGTVKDVVFDHDSGDIRYLVGDLGRDRRVLVPASHVFRSVADDDAFETDLTSADIANLPRFDHKALENEREWEKHHEQHRRFWKEREDRYEAEFKRNWEEDPVMHQAGSERNITPDMGPAEGSGERVITGADLTPHRITDKFSDTEPLTSGSTNLPGRDLTLRPAGTASHTENAAFGHWTRSPRLRGFQSHLRSRIPQLRQACGFCPDGAKRVA